MNENVIRVRCGCKDEVLRMTRKVRGTPPRKQKYSYRYDAAPYRLGIARRSALQSPTKNKFRARNKGHHVKASDLVMILFGNTNAESTQL